ncbi:MAG: hypothetical protein RIB58_02195 [Phycisphaerales bacterium]
MLLRSPCVLVCLASVLGGCGAGSPRFSPGQAGEVRSDVAVHRDARGAVIAEPVGVTWYEGSRIDPQGRPAFWEARLQLRSLEPEPTVDGVLAADARQAGQDLPQGFYPASVATPTQRYIEVLTVEDDLGRTLYDSTEGDGTLPRLDIMLSERLQGRSRFAVAGAVNIGWKLEGERASAVTVTGNVLIPRFGDVRTVTLPLDTLRRAERGRLAFGRGRSVAVTTVTDRVRVTTDGRAGFEERPVEEVVVTVDLDVQAQTDLPIDLEVLLADGTSRPVARWTGGSGSSVRGWSLRTRPGDADPAVEATALRFTLSDRLEFERRPFTITGIPVEYGPTPTKPATPDTPAAPGARSPAGS